VPKNPKDDDKSHCMELYGLFLYPLACLPIVIVVRCLPIVIVVHCLPIVIVVCLAYGGFFFVQVASVTLPNYCPFL